MFLDRGGFQIVPEGKDEGVPMQAQSLGESHARHMRNFLDCVKSRQTPVSNIDDAVHSDIISHVCDIAIRTGEIIYLDMGGMIRAPVEIWPMTQTAELVEQAYNALLADEQNVLIVLVDLGQGRDQIADVGADTEVGELAGVDGDVVGHGGRRRARECPAPGLLYANA